MNYSRVKGIEEIISLIKRIPKTPDNEKTLSIPIVEILQLSTRAINILSQAGIKILSDFLLINPEKLCTARNIGDKTICEIREAVEAQLASATNANIKKRFLKKEVQSMDVKADKLSISKAEISEEEGCNENRPNLCTIGCSVKHPTWGIGVIRDYCGKKGDEKITVDFQDIGLKKLAVKFANLENIATVNGIVRTDDHFETPASEESTLKELKESEEPLSEKLNGLKNITFDEKLSNVPIEKLGLTTRSFNALKRAGCTTTRDIVDILQRKKIASIGRISTIDIKNAIGMIQTYSQPVNENPSDILHTDRHFETPALKEPTFEELSFDENLLNMPIEELDLTERSFSALQRAGCKTIRDIVDFGLDTFKRKKVKNLGRKSIANIKNAILTVGARTQSIKEKSFSEAIESISI